MFYSHEILTQRGGGVATVWLVATLGSRSNLKKVNRKAILNVNIPDTCRIIITPEAPMALRLQSNLLYGVSRVFSQQCGYVLSDAQVAQTNMRALLKAVKTSELDPNAGKTRPEQLILQDDTAFLPDFALPGLDIDLSALEISTDDSSLRSSILSAHSRRTSLSSLAGQQEADESMLGLIIPTSDTGGAGDHGGFVFPSENVSSVHHSARIGRLLDDEDEGFDLDPGFTIDAEGNLVEGRPSASDGARIRDVRLSSDPAVSGHLPQQLPGEPQMRPSQGEPIDLGIELPRFGDDDELIPTAEPFPPMVAPDRLAPQNVLSSERHPEHESSESAVAPLPRKSRKPKQLPVDERQELHNADLAQWKNDYVQNMDEALEAKQSHKAPALAKKNAAFWVMGCGIGGVGAGLGTSKLKSPLDMFAGDSIMEALTGVRSIPGGLKRSREDEEDGVPDSEARRVRISDGEGDQMGRGVNMMLGEDNGIMISPGEGIEIGRHAQARSEDPSFPWNASSVPGSRQGSFVPSRGFASSVAGFPTSAGRPSSVPGLGVIGPSSLDRRASRIPSASPLVGRGPQRYSSLELPMTGADDDLLQQPVASDVDVEDEFQLYGPGAAVDTQTVADSQWVRSALNQEAKNFLAFIEAKVTAAPVPADTEEDELSQELHPKSSITFEEMLPPQDNTKIVAAQALYHVLALATKGLINVKQVDDSIDLSLPAML